MSWGLKHRLMIGSRRLINATLTSLWILRTLSSSRQVCLPAALQEVAVITNHRLLCHQSSCPHARHTALFQAVKHEVHTVRPSCLYGTVYLPSWATRTTFRTRPDSTGRREGGKAGQFGHLPSKSTTVMPRYLFPSLRASSKASDIAKTFSSYLLSSSPSFRRKPLRYPG